MRLQHSILTSFFVRVHCLALISGLMPSMKSSANQPSRMEFGSEDSEISGLDSTQTEWGQILRDPYSDEQFWILATLNPLESLPPQVDSVSMQILVTTEGAEGYWAVESFMRKLQNGHSLKVAPGDKYGLTNSGDKPIRLIVSARGQAVEESWGTAGRATRRFAELGAAQSLSAEVSTLNGQPYLPRIPDSPVSGELDAPTSSATSLVLSPESNETPVPDSPVNSRSTGFRPSGLDLESASTGLAISTRPARDARPKPLTYYRWIIAEGRLSYPEMANRVEYEKYLRDLRADSI